MRDDGLDDGWLSPEAKFYELSDYGDCHGCAAPQICIELGLAFDVPEDGLIERGWLKIYFHRSWYPKDKPVTQKQLDWIWDHIMMEMPDSRVKFMMEYYRNLEVRS